MTEVVVFKSECWTRRRTQDTETRSLSFSTIVETKVMHNGSLVKKTSYILLNVVTDCCIFHLRSYNFQAKTSVSEIDLSNSFFDATE
jgi:hypothetical protein